LQITNNMAVPNQHTNIFIAYAKADENILKLLRKHLTSLERTEGVTIWYDGKIQWQMLILFCCW